MEEDGFVGDSNNQNQSDEEMELEYDDNRSFVTANDQEEVKQEESKQQEQQTPTY